MNHRLANLRKRPMYPPTWWFIIGNVKKWGKEGSRQKGSQHKGGVRCDGSLRNRRRWPKLRVDILLGPRQTPKLVCALLRVLESILRAVAAKRIFSETSPNQTFLKIPPSCCVKDGWEDEERPCWRLHWLSRVLSDRQDCGIMTETF